jgi:hypothetical protein
MRKPKKENAKEKGLNDFWRGYRLGYNQACEDWAIYTKPMRKRIKEIDAQVRKHKNTDWSKFSKPPTEEEVEEYLK